MSVQTGPDVRYYRVCLNAVQNVFKSVAYPGIFCFGGIQQVHLRAEGRENVDLGAVASYSGIPLNLQMSETRILIRLLWMYFPRNREFCSALSKLRNFVEGGVHPTPHPHPQLSTPLIVTPDKSRII
jgi:hypothetical protein